MCGIAGQISADPNKIAANYPAYCRMQKSLARRGPDQRGIYLHGHAALIHARLAVVDLENGCQPMVLDRGGEKYILVYNGELYNTPELHAQLAALGHRFVSHSDTEVLLHAFAQWGPDCLEKLNGIFAFAVWQQRAQKLFLARDRIGVKPLFYALRGDSLIFGSELKTLLCHPEIPPQVDAHGLADVLLLGPGRTPGCGVFRNVQELKPGCCAEYTVPQVGAPRLTVQRYWQLTDHEHPDDFTHTAAKVRDLVMDAVTRQLVSDVPVATFLSGGLDSSLISAIADSRFTARGKTLQTFSVGYQDNKKYFHATRFQPSPDAPYIRTMNQFLNAQHTWVTLDSEALAAALLEAVDARDLPGMAVWTPRCCCSAVRSVKQPPWHFPASARTRYLAVTPGTGIRPCGSGMASLGRRARHTGSAFLSRRCSAALTRRRILMKATAPRWSKLPSAPVWIPWNNGCARCLP